MDKQRKKLLSRTPANYSFWRFTFNNQKETEQFILKGNKEQHTSMIRSLNYLRKFDREYFNKVNGEKYLEQLKGGIR